MLCFRVYKKNKRLQEKKKKNLRIKKTPKIPGVWIDNYEK